MKIRKSFSRFIQVMRHRAKKMLGLNIPVRSYYFDTNALRRLTLDKEIPILLDASRSQSIQLYLCDLVVWEFARKRHQDTTERGTNPTSGLLNEEQKGLHLNLTFCQIQKLFMDNGVHVISSDTVPSQTLQDYISQQDTYFNQENINDCRDARILLTAKHNQQINGAIVVCEDNKLKGEFIKSGYTVLYNAKDFVTTLGEADKKYKLVLPEVSELSGGLSQGLRDIILSVDPTYGRLIQLSQDHDLLISKLNELSRDDKETRIMILAIVQASAPIEETKLINLLIPQKKEVDIKRNVSVLCEQNIIRTVGNVLLPNRVDKEKKEMCEQAMAMKIDVIIDLLSRG
jgi:hypothetical protein